MKIHFIGIGGIGVSALARYYLARGDEVSGSDLVLSEITKELENMGAKIIIGPHSAENIPLGVGRVVFSPAVKQDNPELKKAKESGIEAKTYPEALGELTKQYFTIAVSGTHGKSTTTAMLALILVKAGLDPTVVVGTKLKEFGGANFRRGKGKYLVIEADEWRASFLNYWPKIIALTNIELEHLDYYKDLDHILKTYSEYIGHLGEGGVLVKNEDDKNISKIMSASGFQSLKILDYSLSREEAKKLKEILNVPGEHNVYNASAALTVARELKIPDDVSFEALGEYGGAWRRFEIKEGGAGDKNFTIVSDYGHHPTEIAATLKASRQKFPEKEIWCVFQPHQYQRTLYLFDDFVKVFRSHDINRVIITDIYDVAGRERKDISDKVSSRKLVLAIGRENVNYIPRPELRNYIKENMPAREILVIMGAGDIYDLVGEFSTGLEAGKTIK